MWKNILWQCGNAGIKVNKPQIEIGYDVVFNISSEPKFTNCLQNRRILSHFTDKIEIETMVFVRNTHEEEPEIFPFISL